MRRLRSIQKCHSTAVFLRHFFGCGQTISRLQKGFFGKLIFLFTVLNLGGLNLVGQNRADEVPFYTHQDQIDLPDFTLGGLNTDDITVAIDTDIEGNIYTLSFGNGVSKRNAQGVVTDNNFISASALASPLDIAVSDQGLIYIADYSETTCAQNGKIKIFNQNGSLKDIIYTQFYRPIGIDLDPNANLYVAEYNAGGPGCESTEMSRISIYNSEGSREKSTNNVNRPFRIAVNSKGIVYVSQAGTNNNGSVRIYDENLVYQKSLSDITSPGSIEIDNFDYIHVIEFAGRIDFRQFLNFEELVNDLGAIFSLSKQIYLGQEANDFGVKIFTPDGIYKPPVYKDEIKFPVDITVNSCDRMYVNNAEIDGIVIRNPFNGNLISFTPTSLAFSLEIYQRTPSLDVTPPIASCIPNLTIDLATGESRTITDTELDNGSYDFCGNVTFDLSKETFTEADEGSNTVILTVTDELGYTSVCQVAVQVNVEDTPDTTDPVFSNCSSSTTTISNNSGECGAIVNYTEPTATDDSGTVNVQRTAGPAPGEFFPVGTTTVIYTATDNAGNTAECSFTITVNDDEVPEISCPHDIFETVAFGETGKVVTYTVPFGDNCPGSTIQQTSGQASGTVFPVGEAITNTFVVTDASGKTATCSFNITISEAADEEDPQITCPDEIVSLTDPGECEATITYEIPEATDNSGNATVTKLSGPDSGDVLPPGNYEVVFEARDAADNFATCTLQITVKDEEAPVFTICPSDSVQNISAENGVYVVPNLLELVEAKDNCSTTINYSQSLLAGSEITADVVVMVTASDEYGNEESCPIELVLVEEEQPSFDCGIPPGTLALDGNCNYPQQDFRELITNRQNFDNGIFIDLIEEREGNVLRVNLKVYHGEDENSELVGECNFEISLVDTTAPQIISCDSSPVDTGVTSGENFTVPDYSYKVTYSDNCSGSLNLIQDPPEGAVITENTQVILKVEDPFGNTSDACSFQLNFQQSTSVSCITTRLALGANGTANLDPALIFDGDPNDPAIESMEVNPDSFSCEDLGTQQVALTVSYVDGASATCSTQVEVVDNIFPQIDCPAEITRSFDPAQGFTIPDFSTELNVRDNCPLQIEQVPNPGIVVYQSGEVDIVLEDESGNRITCNFLLILDASREFQITSCPSSSTEELSANCQFQLPDYSDRIETSEAYVDFIQLPSPGTLISEATEVSFTVTGPNGLTDTCTFVVGVEDTTPPAVECPDDITVQAPVDELFVLPDYRELAEVTDNCSYSISQSPAPGVEITGDETEISFSVTDEAGSTITCSFTLFLAEDIPLEITCPGDQSESLEDNCSFVLPNYTEMANVTWSTAQVVQDPPAGTVVSKTTEVILTAVEGNNTASCTLVVELFDNIPPVISCRETFELFLNEEGYGILSPEILLESATDNCGIESATLSKSRFETTDVGENTVVVTVTDINGQVSTCTSTVTVIPFEQSGGVSCTEAITLSLDEEGKRELNLTYSGDEENIELELSKSNFTCEDIGSQMITATYYGEFTGSCEIEIIVVDDLAPVVNCASEINLILDQNGEAEISEEDVDLGSTDNCGIDSIQLSKTSFVTEDVGSQQVRLTVTDASGNTNFCEVTVNVKPYMATTGELNCKDKVALELNDSGDVILRAQDLYAGDTEGVEFFGEISYTCDDIGTHTVVLSKKDDPSQSCEVEVEVVDNIAPVAACIPDFEITLDDNGTATLSAEEFGTGSTDNCEISFMELDRTSFTTADIGEQQVVLTVTDAYGNTSSCEAIITVLTNEENPPAVQCVDLFTISLDIIGRAGLEPQDLYSGGNSEGTFSLSRTNFTCADIGENEVELSYSTPNEEGTCTIKVMVEDPQNFCNPPEPVEAERLILYPNPGNGLIKFKLTAGLQIERIEVFDMRGRFVMEHIYDHPDPPLPYTLDLRALQAGTYPMLIYTNGREYLKRAIIE